MNDEKETHVGPVVEQEINSMMGLLAMKYWVILKRVQVPKKMKRYKKCTW